MCFSANASFVASAALIPSGGLCVHSVLRSRKYRYLALSAVPVFFGIQQFFEGMVWTSLAAGPGGQAACRGYSRVFLFFALSFWPFWMPFIAMLVEKRPRWRLFMAAMMVAGLALGDFIFGPVASDTAGWLRTRVVCDSLAYEYTGTLLHSSATTGLIRLVYLLVAGLPLILSSDLIARRFGLMLLVSATMTHFFFTYAFASVWCFFAAVMSGYLCWALSSEDDVVRTLGRSLSRRWERLSPLRGRS